jgi:hypothetical protein
MSFDSRHPEGYLLALQKKRFLFAYFYRSVKKGESRAPLRRAAKI